MFVFFFFWLKLENAGTEFRGFARESGYEKSNPCSETKGVQFFQEEDEITKNSPLLAWSIYCDLHTSFMGKTVKRAQLFKGWIWEPKREAN